MFADHEILCSTRNFMKDPTIRRRVDKEAMNERDAEVWRLHRQGMSVRGIARELGMPASSVQRCLARAAKRALPVPVPSGPAERLWPEDLAAREDRDWRDFVASCRPSPKPSAHLATGPLPFK
jgi:hypothetical protein